jgi:hypothetical protein
LFDSSYFPCDEILPLAAARRSLAGLLPLLTSDEAAIEIGSDTAIH